MTNEVGGCTAGCNAPSATSRSSSLGIHKTGSQLSVLGILASAVRALSAEPLWDGAVSAGTPIGGSCSSSNGGSAACMGSAQSSQQAVKCGY